MVRNPAFISSALLKAASVALFAILVVAPFLPVCTALAEVEGESFDQQNNQWGENQNEENQCHAHEGFGENENENTFGGNNWHWNSEEHECVDNEHADACPNIDGFQWAIPEGYQIIDDTCVIPVTCSETQHVVANQCVDNATTTPPVICGETQHMVGSICVDNATTTPPLVCGEAQHVVENVCVDNATTTPTVTDNGGGNGNGSNNGGGNGGGNGPIAGSLPVGGVGPMIGGGSVLGASTTAPSCSIRFNKFIMRKNLTQNDFAEVKNLQSFLNDFQKADLEVNGYYNDATVAAVKAFQIGHKKQVLNSWPTIATGHFYLSTRWMANIENCRMQGIELDLPFPTLVPFEK